MKLHLRVKDVFRFGRFVQTGMAVLVGLISTGAVHGQSLFSDDFTGTGLDTTKWRIDTTPFESGISDIAPSVSGGFLNFSGTDTAGYWGGAAVMTVPTFTASPETNLIFQVERVAEFGVGTASRSAIWITDAARKNFILFADNRGEGNWRYNRKIGAAGDNATGSGTAISAFAGPEFTDLGSHVMKAVVNGKTVKLYLDDVFGAEVPFPFSTGIVFGIGSYARAVDDTAGSTFANASVTAAPTVLFTSADGAIQNLAQLLKDTSSTNIAVKIPAGANATQPFTVVVTSSDPTVAAVGTGGSQTSLTFAAGGSGVQLLPVRALKNGGATLTLQNDAGVLVGNSLEILVPYASAGVIMEDTFSGSSIDSAKWQLNPQGFEAGIGDMAVTVSDGTLRMSGGLTEQYWGGVSLKTVQDFVASKELPLVFEVDRLSLTRTGTAGRTGVYITTDNRSRYVFFGQNMGENGWQVNVNPGNPTGGGTAVSAFTPMNNGNAHRMKLVADGEAVDVYLDGVYGGRFSFPVRTGIKFEMGTYARALGDTVQGTFDNVRIGTEYSPVLVSPPSVVTARNQSDQAVTVVVSPAMILASPATVTITSRDPSVAIPEGAMNGALTLTFAAGGSNTNMFRVTPVGVGTTTFDLVNAQGATVQNGVQVSVTEPLFALLSDDFSGATFDAAKWRLNEKALEPNGSTTNDSFVAVSNGVATIRAVSGGVGDAAGIWWGGYALATKPAFSARPTAPVTFEIDRVAHTGTGAERRSAVLIADQTRSRWLMFSEDDLNGGWVYDLSTGTLRQNNTGIAAFAEPRFNDGGRHRIKLLADGANVQLYLDGVFGASVPFPVTNGIVFEFGAFARSFPDAITATFDNALVTGPVPNIYNTPTRVTLERGQATNPVVTVTVPSLLHSTNTARITVTSTDPSVAIPVGGTGGALTLTFGPGSPEEQTFQVARVGSGVTTFTFSNDAGVASTNTLLVIAQNNNPSVLLSDTFSSASPGPEWVSDTSFRFEPQHASDATRTVAINQEQLELSVTATSNYWPGVLVKTATNFQASLSDPLIFEVDRTYHSAFGTGTRAGIYIFDASGSNFVWFGDNSENNVNWAYNRRIGQAGDNPDGGGAAIGAFADPMYKDYGLHRMRLVANGETVRLYLDEVFGAEVPFPFSTGLRVGLMAAARAETDQAVATFDNVTISGSRRIIVPVSLNIGRDSGNVVISWTGAGTLQESNAANGTWTDLPAATSPYSIPAGALQAQKFYRLRQ